MPPTQSHRKHCRRRRRSTQQASMPAVYFFCKPKTDCSLCGIAHSLIKCRSHVRAFSQVARDRNTYGIVYTFSSPFRIAAAPPHPRGLPGMTSSSSSAAAGISRKFDFLNGNMPWLCVLPSPRQRSPAASARCETLDTPCRVEWRIRYGHPYSRLVHTKCESFDANGRRLHS